MHNKSPVLFYTDIGDLFYTYFRMVCNAPFSRRLTCAWEIEISSATSIWVLP